MTYSKDGFHFIANATDDHIQKFCKSNGFRACLQLIIKYPIMTSIISLSSTLLPRHGGNSSDMVNSKVPPTLIKNGTTESMVFCILHISHRF